MYSSFRAGHKSVIVLLLAAKANVNACDIFGWTPLISCASTGKPQCVETLLNDARTDINQRNYEGKTAFMVHITILCTWYT